MTSCSTEEGNGGLDGGEIFGIIFGGFLLVGLAFAAVVWLIWRRREGEIHLVSPKTGLRFKWYRKDCNWFIIHEVESNEFSKMDPSEDK